MAWLDLRRNGALHEHELGAVTTIGRHPDRDLQVLDRSVEKLHATVAERRGVFLLTAHARVRIGGRACGVVSPVALLPGDVVAIGDVTLTFRLPAVTAHGAPDDLAGTPLGQPVPIVRVEGASCDDEDARRVGGAVFARGADHLELQFPGVGVALEAALALCRGGRARGSARIGADLAPLDAARTGARMAAAASDGHVVATDAFAARALMDARLPPRDVLTRRLGDGELPLIVIASD